MLDSENSDLPEKGIVKKGTSDNVPTDLMTSTDITGKVVPP